MLSPWLRKVREYVGFIVITELLDKLTLFLPNLLCNDAFPESIERNKSVAKFHKTASIVSIPHTRAIPF